MKRKVTMQDIADKLGISKNSVSQALTGKGGVSADTKDLVEKTAAELGYVYKGKKHVQQEIKNITIGLIATEFAFSMKSFFGEIFLSVEQNAIQNDVNLLIQSISETSKKDLILPSFIEENRVDGIIIVSHISLDYINKVISTGIPTVLIDHHHPLIHADAILTNNRFGAYSATKHLIDLGHREIAFVGNVDFSPSYYERMEGYLLALKDANINPKDEFMFLKAKEENGVIDQYIRSLKNIPSAWLCVNDGLGFMVSSTLKNLGFKIPEHVSVCNFDNGQLSQVSDPPLTTMAIDLKMYGSNAFKQLLWRIDHPNEPVQEILFPANLIKRGSTGEFKI
ncbi:LacI family DNA-binding transcriptional regulator [Bacillus sp. REN16]|uniref:LacI family DNA-binding transcriptional regulator n=1 Tax=Bacillus sp. REN16 TaxID=2887296 RepID=UPI001E40F6F1|nr:LacI family DNA-binding transcriptional regulator [Bacillus sp. REN16]MCC3356837.1 LacI family DNA-binding transcriptional regulator [Bacillus sp. REN16]